MADAGHAEQDAAVAAHDRDGLVEVLTLFEGEFVEADGDLFDQSFDAADLVVGRCRFGACPVVEFGCRV